jgi:hypothetical protein
MRKMLTPADEKKPVPIRYFFYTFVMQRHPPKTLAQIAGYLPFQVLIERALS